MIADVKRATAVVGPEAGRETSTRDGSARAAAALLLSHLEGVRQTGQNRWLARCPAHDDRRASLSIRELDDGRLLLHDFAGCNVEDVLASVGLRFDALFPERSSDHCINRHRKPFRVGELVRALDFELEVAFIVLADVASGRPLTVADRTRVAIAKDRIVKFLDELRNAA